MRDALHPARSPEFLSRLHDGEVAAAERAAFDSHARACDACRRAVAEYERSLDAFRVSEPIPAAADLSARILRKIRAQTPARRPFGVLFGIDLGWAGASLAALLVLLVAVPLLLRPKASPSPEAASPIPARILAAQAKTADEIEKPEPAPSAANPPGGGRAKVAAKAAAPSGGNEVAAIAPLPRAAPPAPASIPSKDAASEVAVSAEAPVIDGVRAAQEADRREAASPGRLGIARSVRLSVRPADGGGAPPGILASPPDERLEALRGRELLLAVDAAGRVITARTAAPQGASDPRQAAAPQESDAATLEILTALRFEPGQSPRRLLLRVE